MKKAFTLAEVMITLTVIGIITAVIIPAANHSKPDENILKFKKANSVFYQTISTLINSDKYYCDGDLAIKADCTTNVLNVTSTRTYFCKTMAEVLSVKSTDCNTSTETGTIGAWLSSNEKISMIATGTKMTRTVTDATVAATKQKFDELCKSSAKAMGKEIVTTDDIVFYQSGVPQFGSLEVQPDKYNKLSSTIKLRYFSPPNQFPANYADAKGIDISYKIMCIDIDGFDSSKGSTSCDDVKDFCPFGYGVRADGKIMAGARADSWLGKNIQEDN